MYMKAIFRYAVVLLIVGPFVIFIHIARLFVGKQKAIQLCGPLGTKIAKMVLKLVVPKIEKPEEFDKFKKDYKGNFWILKPIYDLKIKEENDDLLKLHVLNCPFCELATAAGISEINPYFCKGDWEIAEENQGLWEFERGMEIGKGDTYCDHTYKRIAVN